ncbi:hypothetical protein [Pseudobutyrivibrio sp.]
MMNFYQYMMSFRNDEMYKALNPFQKVLANIYVPVCFIGGYLKTQISGMIEAIKNWRAR